MTISRMTMPVAAFAAITATATGAATVPAYEAPVNFDNGYSMLGDQTPDNDWTINPVRNDKTGAVMCAGSYKLDNKTAIVTDEDNDILLQDDIDHLEKNTRYIMHFPNGDGTNSTLIRTGFPANIDLNGANVIATPDIANDAFFVDNIPTEITSTSYSNWNNPHFEPHTFVDQIPAMPRQAFEDCNEQAAAGAFDAAFAKYESNPTTIAVFNTSDVQAGLPFAREGSLRTEYMSTFVPATGTVEANIDSKGRIESFNSCDMVSFETGHDGQDLRFSNHLKAVFAGTESGCTQQTAPICVRAITNKAGDLTVNQCVDLGIEETPYYYGGGAVPIARAPVYSNGGNNHGHAHGSGGGSSFGGIVVGGGGGSSTTYGDIFEDNSTTNITNIGDTPISIFEYNSVYICSNNVKNGPGDQIVCSKDKDETLTSTSAVPIGELEQHIVDGAAAIDRATGFTNFEKPVHAVLDHPLVNINGTFMLQLTGTLALLGAGGAFSRKRKTASGEAPKAPEHLPA